MLAASHLVVGGVVGSYIGNPFIAFLVGIIIHFLLDAVPHFDTIEEEKIDYREMSLILVDFLIGAALIIFVIKPDLSLGSPFLWGGIGGMTPDLFDNIPFWKVAFRKTKIGSKVHLLHEKIHSRVFDKHPIPGLLTQYITIAIFIYLYMLKK